MSTLKNNQKFIENYRGINIVETNENGFVHVEAYDSLNTFILSGDNLKEIKEDIDELIFKN